MNRWHLLYSIPAILFGIFMFVYGEHDDSPGGQFLGLVISIIGIMGVIKSRNIDANKLRGKVIIVTGASSGIGEVTALELAKYKVKIIITARRNKGLNDLSKKISSLGSESLVIPADLTRVTDISHLVKSSIKKFGKIDVLVNTAGIGIYKWFEDFTYDEIESQFRINVLGLAELTRQVIPVMKDQRSGHIINMSSYSSRIVFPTLTVYSGTKYAVEGLTDGLRRELAPWGINVSRVHPSAVSGTEFNLKQKRGSPEYKSSSIGRITKKHVAEQLVSLIDRPTSSMFLGRLYDVPALINEVFPWLIDHIAFKWVKKHRKIN